VPPGAVTDPVGPVDPVRGLLGPVERGLAELDAGVPDEDDPDGPRDEAEPDDELPAGAVRCCGGSGGGEYVDPELELDDPDDTGPELDPDEPDEPDELDPEDVVLPRGIACASASGGAASATVTAKPNPTSIDLRIVPSLPARAASGAGCWRRIPKS
jgi:hypothetical protein